MAQKIRAIALGLIEHEGHVFVSKSADPKTQETFYRFLGGGIDFGETSEAALMREFVEEVQAELTQVEYVSCLDNIFEYNGKPKHELIQLFRAQFVDERFYRLDQGFRFVEGDRVDRAIWIPVAKVLSGELRLVPQSCCQYLNG
ncbi:MAG: NUDIX domain-containing protein [Phormidesmis sp.]